MKKLILVLTVLAFLPGMMLAKAPKHTFSILKNNFLLDGKPFQIISGEMHYARVPRAYWRDRLKKAKAMGLNTICTYMFWNAHEPVQGAFDFKDNLDVAEFCKEAAEEGLWVIIRPGPYTCAEWDLGGLPSWLLKNEHIVMRTADPAYMVPTMKYLAKAAKALQPALITNGGNILMVQVENEYGVYGSDKKYLTEIKQTLLGAGINVPLFHCDWAGKNYYDNGHIDGVMPSINFGGNAKDNFAIFNKYAPDVPKFNSEFWTGWFDYWGGKHEVHSAKEKLEDFKWMIDNGVSVNLYMFHGGTSNGFFPGANGSDSYFTPYTTSYDYDAPLNEAGEPNEKFFAFRDVILHKYPDLKLPPLPAPTRKIELPETALKPFASLYANLPAAKYFDHTQNIEALDQAYGLILYAHQFNGSFAGQLILKKVMDRASIYIDGEKIGVLDRRLRQNALPVKIGEGAHLLEILVEPMARVNFGNAIDNERKGITGGVYFDEKELIGWKHYQWPLNDIKQIKPSAAKPGYPEFYKANLQVNEIGDTYLDTRKLDKGLLWLNGKLIGRYWGIGPQQTLYIPGCWLKKGDNEIMVLEMGTVKSPSITGTKEQIWSTPIDSTAFHRKTGQMVKLDPVKLAKSGTLEDKEGWQNVTLDAAISGRYVCLQSNSAYGDGMYTSIAELRLEDSDGKEIPREEYQLLYADSEEAGQENGLADMMIDNQPTTYWHTQWSNGGTKQPHQIVLDMGKVRTIKGFKYLARMRNSNGRVKDYQLYISEDNFLNF